MSLPLVGTALMDDASVLEPLAKTDVVSVLVDESKLAMEASGLKLVRFEEKFVELAVVDRTEVFEEEFVKEDAEVALVEIEEGLEEDKDEMPGWSLTVGIADNMDNTAKKR